MKDRIARRLGAAVLVTLCLAAATAWAGFDFDQFDATLDGVDGSGALSTDPTLGATTTFFALENTTTGDFIGIAQAFVTNESGKFQKYVNATFGSLSCGSTTIVPTYSLYVVYPKGLATLIAVGTEPAACDSSSEPY